MPVMDFRHPDQVELMARVVYVFLLLDLFEVYPVRYLYGTATEYCLVIGKGDDPA